MRLDNFSNQKIREFKWPLCQSAGTSRARRFVATGGHHGAANPSARKVLLLCSCTQLNQYERPKLSSLVLPKYHCENTVVLWP